MKPYLDRAEINTLADLSDLFELLSISLTQPTRELSAALSDGSFFSDLCACLKGIDSNDPAIQPAIEGALALRTSLAGTDPEALYHALNIEFTRLFISPRCEQMPLYESLIVHRDDKKASMFINPTCMHAEQEYRKQGFPFPEKGKTPGDHIAIELRYLTFLLSGYIAAMVQNDQAGAARAQTLLHAFTDAHIVRWYSSFMKELNSTAAHPFYSLIAAVGLALAPLLMP